MYSSGASVTRRRMTWFFSVGFLATRDPKELAAKALIGGTPAELELQFTLTRNSPAVVQRIRTKFPWEPCFAEPPGL